MNLRMIGLAAVVVCTALLPLAASAGPVGGPGSGPAGGAGGGSGSDAAAEPVAEPVALLAGAGAKAGRRPLSGIDGPAPAGGTANTEDAEDGVDALVRTVERCGPEVAAPEGVEAQTCVLTEGRDTWARTYYRNATDGELLAVLSLMGPRGRTVQTHCRVGTTDEPTTCETPRAPSRGEPAEYVAMAEFAASVNGGRDEYGGDRGNGADGEEIGPLLLRSGSNTRGPVAR
nr:hypothetical protein OH820_18220 [Streptomyces sp. NBC_00857]